MTTSTTTTTTTSTIYHHSYLYAVHEHRYYRIATPIYTTMVHVILLPHLLGLSLNGIAYADLIYYFYQELIALLLHLYQYSLQSYFILLILNA